MPLSIQVWDQAIPGRRSLAGAVTIPQARTTVRELIRNRVRQEVERHNASQPDVFRGLVQPEESEQILNGFRMKAVRTLEWESQFERACASFERNGFLLLVDGLQVVGLDEGLDLSPGSEVEFVKLVPLVGG